MYRGLVCLSITGHCEQGLWGLEILATRYILHQGNLSSILNNTYRQTMQTNDKKISLTWKYPLVIRRTIHFIFAYKTRQ